MTTIDEYSKLSPAYKEGYARGLSGKARRRPMGYDRVLYQAGYDAGVAKLSEINGKAAEFKPIPEGIPAPPPGVYSTDWYNGWCAEFEGSNTYLGIITALDEFNAGAKAAQEWKREHGETVDLGFVPTDVLTEAVPPTKPFTPSSELIEDWRRKGLEEALDLMPMTITSFMHPLERESYVDGYNRGIMRKTDEGAIDINTARRLLGLVGEPAVPAEPIFDPVKVPGHYNSGTIEVTNFIADQKLDFPRGNVVKYVSRAGKKDPATEIQDLEKAAAYLQMAHNLANGKPAVVRDPVTKEVVWTLFQNDKKPLLEEAMKAFTEYKGDDTPSEGPYYPN